MRASNQAKSMGLGGANQEQFNAGLERNDKWLYEVYLVFYISHIIEVNRQGRSQDFSKGGRSHWVKHYHHGVFATEYYRLFS